MSLTDLLFGRPLASDEDKRERVGVLAGVSMLGLDALSSAAYGPEAALTLLIPLGAAGVGYVVPISSLIIVLLFIVYFSYRQTLAAYPTGGGSFTVAKENLGEFAGLLAAAALMLDYVLTVAVGISAGVGALVSAVPDLQSHTLTLCLVILGVLTLVNLRGVRESGAVLMLPTYLFIVSLSGIILYGVFKAAASGGHPTPLVEPPAPPAAATAVSFWLLLHAFASGCTAMTGVEAVSNGIQAFREPAVDNAKRTLTVIIITLAALLAGIAFLCNTYHVGATPPGEEGYQSVLSQLTAAVAGKGVVYGVTIGSVIVVLALSANTGFADFPRLCRAVASDGYLPIGFAHRGRRLVYTQGILVLATLSGVLLIAFRGITDRLIPLFAVGAFLAFTMSQAGMVVHWRKVGGKGAKASIAINGLGAVCTGITLVVVLVAKFQDGAWITLIIMPVLLVSFFGVHRHYRAIAVQLASDEPISSRELTPPLVVLPVRSWSVITRKALRFGLSISSEVYALHIASDEDGAQHLQEKWARLVKDPTRDAGLATPRLVVVSSPFRRLFTPLMDFLKELQEAHPDRQIAVIIPELVERRWYYFLLHNQAATVLKGYLYFSGMRRVTVVNVPWYLDA